MRHYRLEIEEIKDSQVITSYGPVASISPSGWSATEVLLSWFLRISSTAAQWCRWCGVGVGVGVGAGVSVGVDVGEGIGVGVGVGIGVGDGPAAAALNATI
jgi:hypothetical protein